MSGYLRGLMVLLLIWGAYVRIGGISDRPFWIDEAWVAYAATHQAYGELLTQTELPMPPLFAASAKLLGSLMSPPELAMRLLPLACGIACVPLGYLTLRTLRVPRLMALAAMSLCASSLILVRWSRELKQYEVEAFFSILLALLVFRILYCPAHKRTWLNTLGVVLICLLGPWFGYGTVFPAATLVAVLIVMRPARGRRRKSLIAGFAALAALLASTVGLWYAGAGAQASHPALVPFTSNWFIHPLEARDWLRAGYYAALTSSVIVFPYEWTAGFTQPGIILWLLVIAAGIWVLGLIGLCTWPGRGRRAVACWVLGPWFLMLMAAIARRYPFAQPRMMVLWAAPMALAAAVGLVRVTRGCSVVLSGRGRPGMVAGLILTLLPATYMIDVPTRHSYGTFLDFSPAFEALQRERHPGELVLVGHMAVPSVRYYAEDLAGPVVHMPIAAGTLLPPDCDWEALATGIAQRAGPRWWVLTVSSERDNSWHHRLLRLIEQQGYELEVIAEKGNAASVGAAQLISVTRRR